MRKRVFDSSFKKMAVELSYAKGSVKEAAVELGIDPGRKVSGVSNLTVLLKSLLLPALRKNKKRFVGYKKH